MKCEMTQTLRRSRLKVIAEMTLSPGLNMDTIWTHEKWVIYDPPTPRPPPWHMLFANEYLRADNPAAFHTKCNLSLLLIELRTRARVEAQLNKKRFRGTQSILFGLLDQENKVLLFLVCCFFHCETDIGLDSEKCKCVLMEIRSVEQRRKRG